MESEGKCLFESELGNVNERKSPGTGLTGFMVVQETRPGVPQCHSLGWAESMLGGKSHGANVVDKFEDLRNVSLGFSCTCSGLKNWTDRPINA